MPAATPHEEAFQRSTLRSFLKAIATFRQPISIGFERCWEPFRELQREMNNFLRQPALSLARISPFLFAMHGTQIPMPGLAADLVASAAPLSAGGTNPASGTLAMEEGGIVCLQRFGEEMAVIPTKTKPKKLLLHGSDGRTYNYLLKGREVRVL